jgi:hypothetical protein
LAGAGRNNESEVGQSARRVLIAAGQAVDEQVGLAAVADFRVAGGHGSQCRALTVVEFNCLADHDVPPSGLRFMNVIPPTVSCRGVVNVSPCVRS